jgi:hypothetical protein
MSISKRTYSMHPDNQVKYVLYVLIFEPTAFLAILYFLQSTFCRINHAVQQLEIMDQMSQKLNNFREDKFKQRTIFPSSQRVTPLRAPVMWGGGQVGWENRSGLKQEIKPRPQNKIKEIMKRK